MVEAAFLLLLLLSVLLIQLSVANEEKIVLPLHEFQWKQHNTGIPICSSPKSNGYKEKEQLSWVLVESPSTGSSPRDESHLPEIQYALNSIYWKISKLELPFFRKFNEAKPLLPKNQTSSTGRTPMQYFNFWNSGSPEYCITGTQAPSTGRENGATVLEVKHIDYCSGRTSDWNQRRRSLISDNNRVISLQYRIKNAVSGRIDSLSQSQIPLTSGIKLQTLNYIVTIELGGKNTTVIVDTGSDLTWVQCQPCKLCYNQQDPLFNPSTSTSYQSVSCNSSTCQSLQFTTGNSGLCGTENEPPTCDYLVSYGDGSYTRGDLARDRLNFGTTTVENFIFGYGRNNRGLFGGASGLVGLGRSNLSLASQTSTLFGGVFSYCLPPTETETSGSLILGGDYSVYKNSTPISFTNMVQNPQLSIFYLANLTGISIGGVTLETTMFGNGGNGILIDSGTVITRLAPSIYKAVKSEFVKQFSGFPIAQGFSILDTCFNLTGYDEVNIPTIRMHFEGDSELNVDVTGIFYFAKVDASHACLAITSLSYEDEVPIIGNYQQRNTRVVYDTMESKLGFAKENCSFM